MVLSECKETDVVAPEEQQRRVWSALCAHNSNNHICPRAPSPQASKRQWPTFDVVLNDVANSDYNVTLECPHDMRRAGTHHKALCPFGVAVCATMELFPCPPDCQSPYTGLLTPGRTLEHCILRLSSAIKPPASESKSALARVFLYAAGEKTRRAKLFPTAAIKVFRANAPSGNLLFGGCKVGQHEANYFAHCMCTQMTERMPRVLKPFVRKFRQYSKHPLSLGVSEFCTVDQHGHTCNNPNFPFAIILSPCRRHQDASAPTAAAVVSKEATDRSRDDDDASFDVFLDHALDIPVGTVLFDVFASPHPATVADPSMLQRIGRIVSSSEMIHSSPNDGLFFRHQRKEEDYELRPDWKKHLKTRCVLSDGSVGTVETLAGWELFEEHISKGSYVDFEQSKHDG